MMRKIAIILVLAAIAAQTSMGAYYGDLSTMRIEVCGAVLDVKIGPGKSEAPDDLIREWVSNSANAISDYYGCFPVKKATIYIHPRYGRGIRGGLANGYYGPAIELGVGNYTSKADFDRDWRLAHEMTHLAFPNLASRHSWLEEGMATYVEPIARTRAGLMTREDYWKELIEGMPNGLPEPGDRGLDNTHTWGRTYWGGALYYLLADIEIHKKTSNRRGIDDVMRAIVSSGGNITVDWDVNRALEVGDKAIGAGILQKLYQSMKDKPVDVDLDKLWKQLGVELSGGRVKFNDGAPLASVRKAMTEHKRMRK